MSSLFKALVTAAATTALFVGGAVSAQDRAVLRQATPPPAPEIPPLANPEIQPQDRAKCPGYRAILTLRGVAFFCYDYDAGPAGYIMVVSNDQYAGAGEAAMAMLMKQSEAGLAYIMDPQTKGSTLHVKHRRAGPAARGVCALTSLPTQVLPCREVISMEL